MAEHESNATNTLLAFALGALAGAAVALLFAPASGEETRRKVRDKTREGRDRVADLAREGRERAAELAKEGREFLNRQREHAEAAFEHGKDVFERASREKM